MTEKKIKNTLPEDIRFAALAVDVVCFRVIDKRLEILVGEVVSEHNKYNGWWAHIGGLVGVEETAEESAIRLMKDKAGINSIYMEQLYTFSKVDRDPRGRVVAVGYIALTNEEELRDRKEGRVKTKWVPVDELPKLGYDHDHIMNTAVERLRIKIMYSDIARHLVPVEFTLSELQQVYDVVLGEETDKRNFRKRILSLGILVDTGEKVKKGVMRPATVYRFK